MAGLALRRGIILPATFVVMKARFGHLLFMPSRHERLNLNIFLEKLVVHGSADIDLALFNANQNEAASANIF
jgi:hypothetical protein